MGRLRAHLAAIEALESLAEGRPGDVSRPARHYCDAGPGTKPERAVAVLVAAGERACALCAKEEAARYFRAALEVVRKGGGSRVEG